MSLVEIAAGLFIGFLLGIGAALFYLRWKMKRQLGNLEDQMSAMMDIGEEIDEMVPEKEDSVEETEGE